jgi:hypothetical protein
MFLGGWMDGWMGGWMGGCKSRFKDCLQQSKITINNAVFSKKMSGAISHFHIAHL